MISLCVHKLLFALQHHVKQLQENLKTILNTTGVSSRSLLISQYTTTAYSILHNLKKIEKSSIQIIYHQLLIIFS